MTGTLAATVTIKPPPLAVTTTSPLTPGTVGVAYSVTFAATGGTTPYTWSVTTGTLPAGLTLTAAGVLSGTPTTAGTSMFTVQVADSSSTQQTATLAATLVINPAPLAITSTSPLPTGTVGTAYSETLAATGGTTPYGWTVTKGTLPAGLTLSAAGVLSGTPTAAGTSTFTVQVADSSSTKQTATLAATLVINPVPLAITTTSPLPGGTLGTPYVTTFAATGGTTPYKWSVTSGAPPAGLTLASSGQLSGTPTAGGPSSFTVQVSDSATTPQTVSAPFTLTISVGTLAVTTTSLPSGNVGTAYSAQLAATGGAPPYTWSVTAGALPTGLTLSAAGLVSGTPGSTVSAMPTFTVTDSAKHTASASLSMTINAATGTVPDNFYSFLFAGTAPQGTPVAANGIAINGIIKIQKGQVVSGFYDENFNTNPPVTDAAITGGSLVLGANGIGQLVLTTASSTMTFSLASPASVSTGGLTPIRMIEFDDATGTGSRGSGVIDPTPPPTPGAISGNFAFLLSGTDIEQNQQALIGSFQTDGAGHITGGKADANQVVPVNGIPTRQFASFSNLGGSYSVDASGRGSLTLTLGPGTSGFHYSFYEVSPQEWLVISLDPATLNSPLVSGIAYQQAAGPFSTASLPALSVLEVSGVKPASETGGAPVPDVTLGLASSNGSGHISYTFDEYAGTLSTGGTLGVTYSVDATTGRAVTTGNTEEPILYIINSTSAFVLGSDTSGSSGIIEAQTGSSFTNASFNGNYLGGSLPLVLTSVLNENGLVTADGAGNISFTTNRSTATGLVQYQNVTGTYSVDGTGRVVVTTPDKLARIFYVVSPTKVVYLTGDMGGYLGSFQQ
jgi:hypothetical protein